jgi:hypothetical protein
MPEETKTLSSSGLEMESAYDVLRQIVHQFHIEPASQLYFDPKIVTKAKQIIYELTFKA